MNFAVSRSRLQLLLFSSFCVVFLIYLRTRLLLIFSNEQFNFSLIPVIFACSMSVAEKRLSTNEGRVECGSIASTLPSSVHSTYSRHDPDLIKAFLSLRECSL